MAIRKPCLAASLLAFFVLCIRGGSAVSLLFADTDIKVYEDSTAARATVRVNDFTENVTMVVIPLTVAQYRQQSDVYGSVCDSLINDGNMDEAEVEDFISDPVEKTVSPHQVSPTQRLHEFTIDIPLVDDDIQEPAEFFLLVLATKPSDSDAYTIRTNAGRQCSRVDINADNDDFGVTFVPMVTTVREEMGDVEVVRVTKLGRTEQTVVVSVHIVPGYEHTVSGLPIDVVLTKDDTSAVVTVTIIDNDLPADDTNVTIYGIPNVGAYGRYRFQELSHSVTFTVLDNDQVELGFVQTDVTVIEGEEVFLTTSFRNNVTSEDYYREFFTVSTRLNKGNATAQKHYIELYTEHYFPGDPIKIPTVDDDELERARWFEVRLIDPGSNSLTKLEPNIARVTILDNDGTPNQPSIGKVTFYRRNITVSWSIERDELRPVKSYTLTIAATDLGKQNSSSRVTRQAVQDGGGTQVREVALTNVQCKFNPSSQEDFCESAAKEEVKIGTAYNVTLCAVNEFSLSCEDYAEVIETLPAEVTPEGINRNERGIPFNTVIGIVIGIALLLVCLTLIVITVFCVVGARKRRRREKEHGSDGDTERHSRGTATPSLYSTASVES